MYVFLFLFFNLVIFNSANLKSIATGYMELSQDLGYFEIQHMVWFNILCL